MSESAAKKKWPVGAIARNEFGVVGVVTESKLVDAHGPDPRLVGVALETTRAWVVGQRWSGSAARSTKLGDDIHGVLAHLTEEAAPDPASSEAQEPGFYIACVDALGTALYSVSGHPDPAVRVFGLKNATRFDSVDAAVAALQALGRKGLTVVDEATARDLLDLRGDGVVYDSYDSAMIAVLTKKMRALEAAACANKRER